MSIAADTGTDTEHPLCGGPLSTAQTGRLCPNTVIGQDVFRALQLSGRVE